MKKLLGNQLPDIIQLSITRSPKSFNVKSLKDILVWKNIEFCPSTLYKEIESEYYYNATGNLNYFYRTTIEDILPDSPPLIYPEYVRTHYVWTLEDVLNIGESQIKVLDILFNDTTDVVRNLIKYTKHEKELPTFGLENLQVMGVSTNLTYQEYLQTPHWKKVSQEIRELYSYKCMLCGRTDRTLNVHHNNYKNLWKESYQDLILLCRSCHYTFHRKNI